MSTSTTVTKSESNYSRERWEKLLKEKQVIPFENLPLPAEEFQSRVSVALYQLAKEMYDQRNEMKAELKKLKRLKGRKVVEETDNIPVTVLKNPFDLLADEQEDQ